MENSGKQSGEVANPFHKQSHRGNTMTAIFGPLIRTLGQCQCDEKERRKTIFD